MAGFTPAERQRQRLKKKLAAKSKAEANEENASPADVAKALEVAQGGSDDRGTAALAALQEIEDERQRVATKAGGNAITPDLVKSANTMCKVGKVHVDTGGGDAMSADEKRKLAALVGNGKAQNVRLFHGLSGAKVEITEEVLGDKAASLAVVLAGCTGCEFVLDAYCAKVFVRGLVDCSVTLAPSSKVITATLEVERCQRTALRIKSMLGTLQVEQCQGIIADFESRDCFGNGSMERKGRDFGNDGMIIWAGCDDLRVRIGDAALGDHACFCDFAVARTADPTLSRDRSQFKVSFANGKLISEKVTRLKNGFPATAREEAEFDRREEQQLNGLAERMGITIHRKEDKIGSRVKPNEPCPCGAGPASLLFFVFAFRDRPVAGSGKKYKKCCSC